MRLNPLRATCAWVFASFVLVALLQSWPLALHLGTELTGPPGGDTGVYVWNTWVFRRELIELGRQPYVTDAIFWSSQPANLSLHNYTAVADTLAMLLQPVAGVVGAFNLVYLINAALAGFGMYLLATRYTRDRFAAWLAGLLFACSPFLIARSLGHFSLAAAAPLPLFVWQLERTFERPTAVGAIGVGAIAAWAGLSDPYYAVYCLMLGCGMAAARYLRLDVTGRTAHRSISRADIVLGALVVLIAGVALAGTSELHVGSVRIGLQTLYTPVLLATLWVVARTIVRSNPRLSIARTPSSDEWQAAAISMLAAAVFLSPWLFAIVLRLRDDAMVSAPVLWRSSMPGVDLLAFLVPNPLHPLMPAHLRDVMAAQPGGFLEQVASLPLVSLAVIGVALARGVRLSRWWIATTIFFVLLALGPFVHVAGVNTYVPTPWTFLRYVPVISQARAPARFAVLAVMGCAVLFAQAFGAWRAQASRRRVMAGAIAVLLAFEVLPAPRALYSADIPAIYSIIAKDPRPVSVLELPFGLRDGLSSLGDFTAQSQFFQTFHKKPLFGGYLSRISERRKRTYRGRPMLGALMALSEGRAITPEHRARARASAASFVQRTRLGYVVIDEYRASPELRDFAIEVLRLKKVATSGSRELYVPSEYVIAKQ